MESRIPAIKLSHALLRDAISTIAKNEGDRETMDKEVYQIHLMNSKRPQPPSKKNATRAVTYPSLRHLGLIYGEGSSIKLTSQGAAIVRGMKEGANAYTRALAIHLVQWDDENVGVLDKMDKFSHQDRNVSVEKLVSLYWAKSDQRIATMDLNRLLSFYEEAKLISRDNGQLTMNHGQIAASRNPSHNPPKRDEFVRVLLREYLNEVRSGRSPLVPIPVLERRVGDAFGGRLWSDEFRRILLSLPKETSEYLLHFGQPMTRESQGIRIGGQYFYYIQIQVKANK